LGKFLYQFRFLPSTCVTASGGVADYNGQEQTEWPSKDRKADHVLEHRLVVMGLANILDHPILAQLYSSELSPE
jgi:hypothetical protein